MKLKNIFYFILGGFIFFVPSAAFAITTEVGPADNLAQYVSLLLTKLMFPIAGFAILAIIFAGYLYMTSQGNPESVNKAKDIIIGVVVGVLLLFLLKALLNQIGLNQT
jgi:hypothetical protein